MKTQDLQIAAAKSVLVEKVAKFEVGLIQSITVQANMHDKDRERGNNIALRVDPSDPRYAVLETMLKDEAAAQKTQAHADLTAMGMTVVVDQAVLDAHAAQSAEAKAEYDELVERNRQKKILADALAADAAARAAQPPV